MAIYELDGQAPDLPSDGNYFIAETATVTYISPAWATAVPYLVIFVVLLVRPQGLMGARLREDVATA